ncbi:hypothetical protein ACZ87_03584 [Candidatus Erwinia dacicola]|uniref:Uncharacterized protein n=1 Tax=Candidatus Erwinia dacicola TaxID=252393 RepID=A0A328TP69_9GAMM|nr:hypothetical protein ACZ87_03584 [Candidatus Erwinia dacicola]
MVFTFPHINNIFMVFIALSGNFILASHIDEAETGLCWDSAVVI